MQDDNANSHPRLLLVDDDESLLELLRMRLSAEGYEVQCADNASQALLVLERFKPQAVLTDLRMDGMDGMGLFEKIQRQWPSIPVIIMTAHGSIPEAVKATQEGVFSFVTKPIDHGELRQILQQAINCNTTPTQQNYAWSDEIITQNVAMTELLEQAKLVAAGDTSILITGQSGTGKEVLAKAIHKASQRAGKPFICINCGAIPEDLLESELFGHKKGAFTGAHTDHIGLFEAADGGTLFLDEIGDMPLKLQVKLLRVIQERTIRPVGGNQDFQLDVRILSATHQNLLKESKVGHFREDLYYRLNVVNFDLPPLDQRKEDIPLLVNHFLANLTKQSQKTQKHFTAEGMKTFVSANWPGNIRQLSNAVEQCFALSKTRIIPNTIVNSVLQTQELLPESLSEAKKEFERKFVIRLLKMTEGNITRAAQFAQRNRSDFHKIMRRHDIDADIFKTKEKA